MFTKPSLKDAMFTTSASLLMLLATSGCSAVGSETGEAIPGGDKLSAEARAACEEIFSREIPDAGKKIVAVYDATASNAGQALGSEFIDSLREASKEDGSFTLIAVEGADTAPRIVAKSVALSSEGPRDRPSVEKIAEVVPLCVEQVLLPLTEPTSSGTDLHRAVALASEMLGDRSELWVRSDFVSTTGSFRLDGAIVKLDAEAAIAQIAEQAPVDLRGAPVKFDGIGNTFEALRTANREWLRDVASGLCVAWNGIQCEEISTDPVEPTPGNDALPEDPLPLFPVPTETTIAGGCHFDVPAHLTFEAGLADLRSDAATVLATPRRMVLEDSGTTLEVIGHTASVSGSTGPSLDALSQERANAVAQFFIDAGIDPARVRAIGVGDTQPISEDLDPVTGQQIPDVAAAERRVEILVHHASCSS